MAWRFFVFFLVLTHGYVCCSSLSALNNPQDCSTDRAASCISRAGGDDDDGGPILSTPSNTSYYTLMDSFVRNPRFRSPNHSWPALLISATRASHVQAAILCCKAHGLPIRVRSGGHDYEGLSYLSLLPSPFAMLDLSHLRSIHIDMGARTAWVGAGATLGELYYRIWERSMTHGFPAGNCPSVGVAGHVSGGGHGPLARKFGLASDQAVDATIVGVEGKVMDRESMGEDLFWAIRGGGGESFGVVLSWKLTLVPVPSLVTVFTITKHDASSEGVLALVIKWQDLAHDLPADLYLKLDVVAATGRGVEAVFKSLYLGRCFELLNILGRRFPELGVGAEDCREMSWIRSAMYFAGLDDDEPMETLLVREVQGRKFFKGKSDFLSVPIPWRGWKRILRRFSEEGAGEMYIDPYGGKMKEITEFETPFPHRNGTLFNVQYVVNGRDEEEEVVIKKRMDWVRDLYKEMTPFVSRDPRGAYLNYRDLDLGSNGEGRSTSFSAAMAWGVKYFKKNNFERLAKVKRVVDPQNYFWNEQSIPHFTNADAANLVE